MNATPKNTVSVTTFFIEDPPDGGAGIGKHPWQAVATAHAFDADLRPPGLATQEAAVLSGQAFVAVTSRATAQSEEMAAQGALRMLLERLRAKG